MRSRSGLDLLSHACARSVRRCADCERGSPAQAVSQFLEQRVPMIILADVGNTAEAKEPLARWIEDGGVLVRFAGPRLAASDDDLVPVRLRRAVACSAAP